MIAKVEGHCCKRNSQIIWIWQQQTF